MTHSFGTYPPYEAFPQIVSGPGYTATLPDGTTYKVNPPIGFKDHINSLNEEGGSPSETWTMTDTGGTVPTAERSFICAWDQRYLALQKFLRDVTVTGHALSASPPGTTGPDPALGIRKEIINTEWYPYGRPYAYPQRSSIPSNMGNPTGNLYVEGKAACMRVIQVKIDPFGPAIVGTEDSSVVFLNQQTPEKLLKYEKCIITVTYGQTDLLAFTNKIDVNSEYLNLDINDILLNFPTGAILGFRVAATEGFDDPDDVPSGVGAFKVAPIETKFNTPAILIRSFDWVFTFHRQQEYPINDIANVVGTINDAPITVPPGLFKIRDVVLPDHLAARSTDPNTLGQYRPGPVPELFPGGTLLFQPPQAIEETGYPLAVSAYPRGWRITYRLSYRPETWNRFYRPKTKRFHTLAIGVEKFEDGPEGYSNYVEDYEPYVSAVWNQSIFPDHDFIRGSWGPPSPIIVSTGTIPDPIEP
jgi:hypothetical protein